MWEVPLSEALLLPAAALHWLRAVCVCVLGGWGRAEDETLQYLPLGSLNYLLSVGGSCLPPLQPPGLFGRG